MSACFERITHLAVVEIPVVVIAFNTAFPVFVFDIENCVWRHYNKVVFPILCTKVFGIGGGNFYIGNKEVIVWEVDFQKIQQFFFAGVDYLLEIRGFYNCCHWSISFSMRSIAWFSFTIALLKNSI